MNVFHPVSYQREQWQPHRLVLTVENITSWSMMSLCCRTLPVRPSLWNHTKWASDRLTEHFDQMVSFDMWSCHQTPKIDRRHLTSNTLSLSRSIMYMLMIMLQNCQHLQCLSCDWMSCCVMNRWKIQNLPSTFQKVSLSCVVNSVMFICLKIIKIMVSEKQ